MKKMTLVVLLLAVIGMVSALHASAYVTVNNVWYENGNDQDDVSLTIKTMGDTQVYHQTRSVDGNSHVYFNGAGVPSSGNYKVTAKQGNRSVTITDKWISATQPTYFGLTLPGPAEIHNPPQTD